VLEANPAQQDEHCVFELDPIQPSHLAVVALSAKQSVTRLAS
jgi:hypothetical protein